LEVELTDPPIAMSMSTCQESCKNESLCTQWSWENHGRRRCYLSKTLELQSECETYSYDVTTGQVACPGINYKLTCSYQIRVGS
jgi:hypothetical protein